MQIQLIPQPQRVCLTTGEVYASDYHINQNLIDFVPISATMFPVSGGKYEIRYMKDALLSKEEYKLNIKIDGIDVVASAPEGAYYALCTLKQLIDIHGNNIPCCKIEDKPFFEMRGYSGDNSRGEISTFSNFKDIIRRLSFLKYNIYMPYIEDIIKFECLPESGKFSGGMEKGEWRELVEYAKQYYITIVPIINCIGHWDKNAGLDAFREFCLHEEDNPDKPITADLDPRKPEVLEMLKQMLNEAVEIFGTSGMIHLGGDEVTSLVPIFGREGAAKHYNRIYKELYTHLKAKGIKTLLYSDMYMHIWGDYGFGVEHIDEMPEDMYFVYWDYGVKSDYPKIKELRSRNKRFFVSPSTFACTRFLPCYYASWQNTRTLAMDGKDSGGLFMSAWCDGGMNLREENWFGIFAGSVFSWNPESTICYEETVVSFFAHFYGIYDLDFSQFKKLTSYDFNCVKSINLPEYKENGSITPEYFLWTADEGIKLCKEFVKDVTAAPDKDFKQRIETSIDDFETALSFFEKLLPTKNVQVYEVFLFDIRRSWVAAKKTMLMKEEAYRSREQAMADIPKIEKLIEEIEELKKMHRKLWFDTNRESEWGFTEAVYLNIIDNLRSLTRYCRYSRRMNKEKVMV